MKDLPNKGITGVYAFKYKGEYLYVCFSVDIKRYMQDTLISLRKNKLTSNPPFQLLYNKIGIDNLEYEIIERCEKEELMEVKEKVVKNLKPKFNVIYSPTPFPLKNRSTIDPKELPPIYWETREFELEELCKYHREYRQNMTPEQKEARNKYYREYYKNLTPEEKEAHNKYQREWYQNMTPEEKEAHNKYQREYYQKSKTKKS